MSCVCYKNIVVMGDSVSKGVIYDLDKKKYLISKNNFCSVLNDKMSSAIYNVSKFGSTITRGMSKINQVFGKNPDAVLIEFGGNDCNFDWKAISDAPTLDHFPQTPVDEFEAKLKELATTFRNKDIEPIFMTLPPLAANSFFDWVTSPIDVNPTNVLSWLGCVERIYWWHEQYNSIIIDVAEQENISVINIRSAFLKQKDYRDYLCVDGMHPNEKGQALIARRIESYLQKHNSELLVSTVS